MKTTTKVLVLLMVFVMLLGIIPFNAFAATTYTVTLKCGPEGAGTATKTLTKTAGQNLSLQYTNSGIKSAYGMYPSSGGSGFGAQRVFIEWNTEVNANGKGVGKAYRNVYNVDANVTLYAVWGFEIQYNADGGIFPATGNDIFLKYVADCDDNNYQNPKTLYGNFDLPEGAYAPTKEGCRRRTMSSGADFYGLLNADMSFFTTETSAQNLTIPPTGGKLPWSVFHTTTSAHGNTAVEFYAIWEPSVTYHPNTGSGNAYSEYLTWDWGPLHCYDSYYVKSNTFSRSGAVFKGWNTKPDGTGVSYSAGQNIGGQRSNSDPITLYAQWSDGSYVTPAKKYTMTFDVNGGFMMAGTTYQIEYGQNFGEAMGINMPTPYRSGYNFLGWYCEKYNYWLNTVDNMGVKDDLTFVAQWESAVPTYTLTFNTDGGTMPSGFKTSYTFKEGERFNTVINGFPIPTKAGYIFSGWKLISESNLVVWTTSFGDQTFTYGENITIIAVWAEDPNYIPPPEPHNVTFMLNGGTMPSGFSTSYIVYDNEDIEESIGGFPVPTKTAYLFKGWKLSVDSSVTWTDSFEGQSYTYGTDIVLFAMWEEDPDYVAPPEPRNVTFNVNGGTMPKGFATTYVVYDNASIAESIGAFPVPTKLGYIFDGWQLSVDKSVIFTDSFGDLCYIYGVDATLTALWSVDPNYVPPTTPFTVTFNANGGVIDGQLNYSICVGQTYKSVITSTPKIVRDGYKFVGWRCSGTDYILDLNDIFVYEANVTFKAQWEAVDPNGIFIMTLDPNGGTMPAGYSTTYEFRLNQKFIDVIGGYPVPTKAGCTFNGWLREDWPNDHHWTQGWGSQPYSFGHDVTLIAQWIENCSHSYYQSGYIAASCDVDGYTAYTCSKCGAVRTDVITATGHSYDNGVVTKAATCTDKGVRTYTCANNSAHTYTVSVSALGHQYKEAIKVNNLEPTCEADGGYDMAVFCGRCNVELTKTHYTVSATGHSYGEWSVYKEATTVEAGEERSYCTNSGCTSYQSREIPKLEVVVTAPILTVNNKIVSITSADDITELAYATGIYDSYAELENADDCMFFGAAYIGSNSSNGIFNIELEAGTYTFYTLMSDGSEYLLIAEVEEAVVEPDEPEIPKERASVDVDGVTITVSGLVDINDVFIAKGVYSTYREVNTNKIVRATQSRVNESGEYSYNVPGSGNYTVCVRFNDGGIEFLYPVVDVAEPTFTTNGLQLTIGGLEGIKVIRTAMGEYTSVSQIKKAQGNRAFTAKYITNPDAYMVQYRETATYTVAICYANGYTVIATVDIAKKIPVFEQEGNTVIFSELDGLKVVRYAMGEYSTSTQIKAAAGSKAIQPKSIVDGKITVTLKNAGTYTFCVQFDDESYNYYTVTVE
ncbi:MAG: InlB B-repeat-containing protein [Clostridia bacterium]|nr:InlB B-repeat-containing protein [Clostridia bacterium]